MMNFKSLVSNNFNKAYSTYDKYAKVQKETADLLVKLLKNKFSNFYPNSILDLGTGTGYVVSNLASIFPKSTYTINDISYNMAYLAAQKLPQELDLNIIVGDMETINFQPHELIISNFAFQWLSDLHNSVQTFYNRSKILAFTCLLEGTFKELDTLLEKRNITLPLLLKYSTYNNMKNWLEDLVGKTRGNMLIVNKRFDITFTNVVEFFRYLKNLGAKVPQLQYNVKGMKNLFLYSESFSTCYNVLFVILVNNNYYANFS